MSSEGWISQKLGNLIEINAKSITGNFPFKEIEYLDTSSVTNNIFEPLQKLKLGKAPRRAKRIVRDGDTILSTVRPIQRHFGFIRNPQPNTIASTGFVVLTPKKIHPEFLYYYLSQDAITYYLNGIAETTTTTFPAFRPDTLEDLEIEIPADIQVQHRIVGILSTLDEKIELNHQTNATLEAIAQAIFKEWFVNFNFPGATGEMVESELGMIPKEWEVKPLPEAIEVNPSRALRKGKLAPYLDMANMPTQGHRGIEWVDRPFGSGTKFINGDTLLARITPCLENGKTAFVDFLADGQTGWGSTEYIVLHPKAPLPPEYGYYLARFNDFRNHAIRNMIGTSGRQRTPASSLDNFLMVVPAEVVAKQFGVITASIISKVRAYDEESRSLAAMRDALLPKLMDGEIDV